MNTPLIPTCWRWQHYALLAAVALAAVAPFDLTIAQLCYSNGPPPWAFHGFEIIAEIAGGGLGVFLLIVACVSLDRKNLGRFPVLVASSLGAGLLADLAKLCVSRARPHSIDLSSATFASTFSGLLPAFSAGSRGQSFPSGHSATAAGFAIAMCVIYPRARWLLATLAATVAVSRVIVHAHFPTDVIAGALLGGTWALACHDGFAAPPLLWCRRAIEDKLARRTSSDSASTAASNNSAGALASTAEESNNDPDRRNAA
jgi:membrane-associated phospholipid phosphatase